ncbi:MAG: fibronectin type III domain-containing protein, partial [Eubacterium sp.]|nr:fibronectin type III domain-containing protein [Eubacterium sp.]
SQAISTAEAKKEAEFTLDQIKSYKSWINLPVYFDYEFAGVSSGRLDSEYKKWKSKGTHKAVMTSISKMFCDTVRNAGYKSGIYASKSFYEENLNMSQLESNNSIWVAHYISKSAVKTGYAGKYNMWQYSSTGYIGSKKFDVNFLYEDSIKVDAIANQSYTGSALTPNPTVRQGNTVLKKGTDYNLTYQNNVNLGTGKVTITFINKYSGVSPITTTFKIIPKRVEGLDTLKLEKDAVSFSWSKHSDCDGYQILYNPNSEGWKIAGTTNELSYKLENMLPASDYLVTVRAFKKVGGVTHYGFSAYYLYAVTMPVKVTNVKFEKKGPDYLKITWDKQKYATKYEVYMFNPETSKYELEKTVNSGDTNICKIKELTSNRLYYFKVRAIKYSKNDDEFIGDFSNRAYNYTSVNTPEPKTIASNSYKKIAYKYSKVPAASGYQVQWSTSKSFSENTKKKLVAKSKSSYKITTGSSNKKYYVRIRAYKLRNNKKYYSPWSKKLYVKVK